MNSCISLRQTGLAGGVQRHLVIIAVRCHGNTVAVADGGFNRRSGGDRIQLGFVDGISTNSASSQTADFAVIIKGNVTEFGAFRQFDIHHATAHAGADVGVAGVSSGIQTALNGQRITQAYGCITAVAGEGERFLQLGADIVQRALNGRGTGIGGAVGAGDIKQRCRYDTAVGIDRHPQSAGQRREL